MLNDHKVAEDLKRVVKRELQDEVDARPDGQSNVSRQAFMLCNHCSWCKKKNKKCDALGNVCGGCIKKTRRVAGGVIWCIMIKRGDVQRVMDAFILE